jgi:bacterioferritin
MDLERSFAGWGPYLVDLPYPAVAVAQPNPRYARIISDAYAGRGSETTAIAQYVSHRYFLQGYPEVYQAYRCIALVETIHHELLGSLIRDLGLSPLLASYETNQYWNGSFPEYATDLNRILESDIRGEQDAIAHYTRMIESIDDPAIQKLLRRIILDEQKHVEVLCGFFRAYFGSR